MSGGVGIAVLTFVRSVVIRIPLYITVVLVFAGAVFSVSILANFFGKKLSQADSIADTHRVVRGGRLAGELFRDLVNGGYIRFDRKTGLLQIGIDCGVVNVGLDNGTDRALKLRFCSIDIGTMVREQIEEWNARASLISVRDNRRNLLVCIKNMRPPGIYVKRGCYPNNWSGKLKIRGIQAFENGHSFAIVNEKKDEPDPQVYGFLATIPIEGFGDWRRFPNPEGALVVASRFNIRQRGGRTIVIDYIGELSSVAARQDSSAGRILPPLNHRIMCANFRSNSRCVEELKKPGSYDLPRAGRLVYRFPQNWKGEVVLVLKPSIAVHARVRNLKKAIFITPENGRRLLANPNRTINISRSIQAKCRSISNYSIQQGVDGESDVLVPNLPNEAAERIDKCMLSWNPSMPSGTTSPALVDRVQERLVKVTAGTDETAMLSKTVEGVSGGKTIKKSVLSQLGLELGLAAILGFDDNDPSGLLGFFRSQTRPGSATNVALTIDLALQKTVHTSLRSLMRGSGRYKTVRSQLLPGKNTDRKATLLLMDAGPSGAPGHLDPLSGRILAVSNWPAVHQNLSQWDLLAQASFRPTENPLATRAWSQNNRLYAPGSAFKPVIALAAINRAANGDKRIASYLGIGAGNKGLGSGELSRTIGGEFGFSFRARSLRVPRIANGRTVEIASIGNRGKTMCSRIRGGTCGGQSRLTMTDMLVRSDNVYFSRLALLLDADNLSSGKGSNRVELVDSSGVIEDGRHFIQDLVTHIWPSKGTNLLAGSDTPTFSRLYTSSIQIDSTIAEHPRLYRLALNGIGQSAQATPLAMATVAASISSGTVVKPWLAGNPSALLPHKPLIFADVKTAGGTAFNAATGRQMLQKLRGAMKEVVLRGTAKAAFPKRSDASDIRNLLRDNLYGKTGTAQIGNPDVDGNTVWFIGWLEGSVVPGYEDRRIAFACMISHAKKRIKTKTGFKGVGGGSVCAPIIRELFLDLAKGGTSAEMPG